MSAGTRPEEEGDEREQTEGDADVGERAEGWRFGCRRRDFSLLVWFEVGRGGGVRGVRSHEARVPVRGVGSLRMRGSIARSEEGDTRGEAVDVVAPRDGTDFTHGEEAGGGDGPEDGADGADVVMGFLEEARAASVAGDDERGIGGCEGVLGAVAREEGFQILVRGGSVPDVELDGLADADQIGHGDRALLVEPHDISDKEIAMFEAFLILIHDAADMEALAGEGEILGREFLGEFLEDLDGGAASEFEDEVAIRPGDEEGSADGPAALGDHGAELSGLDHRGDGALLEDVAIENEAVSAGARAGACHAADEEDPRPALEIAFGGEGEGIREEQDGGTGPGRGQGRCGRTRGGLVLRFGVQGEQFHRSDLGEGEQADGGLLLDFLIIADDGFGGAAQDVRGQAALLDFGREPAQGRRVRRGREEEDEVEPAGRRRGEGAKQFVERCFGTGLDRKAADGGHRGRSRIHEADTHSS